MSNDGYGRMTFASVGGHSVTEEYSPRQERVLVKDQSSNGTVQTVYFWGARGERLGTYSLTEPQYQTNTIALQKSDVYFAGRRIDQRYDRLGSVGGNGPIGPTFYPYGEQVGGGSLDGDAFATYDRNATIGLDYARNRQYASGWGRFTSADPYQASAGLGSPQGWNRYAYVGGDPANRVDKSGLFWCEVVGGEGYEDVSCIPEPSDDNGGEQVDQSGPLPGGGGGTGNANVDGLNDALRILASRTEFSQDCLESLKAVGLNVDQLRMAAHTVNATPSTASQSIRDAYGMTNDQQRVGRSAQTQLNVQNAAYLLATSGGSTLRDFNVADYFFIYQNTIAYTPWGGANIYVNVSTVYSRYFTPEQNLGRAFHELIHNILGTDDDDIAKELAPLCFRPDPGGSSATTRWFAEKCAH